LKSIKRGGMLKSKPEILAEDFSRAHHVI